MKILFLSRWFPYPADNGSRIRISNLIAQLAWRHEIDLISFTSEPVSEERLAAAREHCRSVKTVPYRAFQPNRLGALVGFLSPRPRSVVDTFSAEMLRQVQESARHNYDAAIASEIDMIQYGSALNGVPKVVEDIELTPLFEQVAHQSSLLKKLRSELMWAKLSRYVAGMLHRFDGCTVVSEQERVQVLRVAPGYQPIGIVPNGVNVQAYTGQFGPPESDTLIYSGALTYDANLDAVSYFVREVLPLIRARRPGVRLYVTGKTAGVAPERLPAGDGVILTGYLDDIRPAIARSWASVVPLRVGGGTRLKILESLALGTPVVSTSKGAEGLELVQGRDLLVADEPEPFADAVLRVLGDAGLRRSLSCNGQHAVAARYDWSIIGWQFDQFMQSVASARQASNRDSL